MHSSATVAAGELYMGLVEAGVGLIPAGGGTKELIFRALRDIPQDIDYDPNPFVQKVFQRIGLANITSSGLDAQASGYLRRTDKVVMDIDALLGIAKQTALGLAQSDYVAPEQRTVKLPGPTGAAAIELFLYQMTEGGQASEHDALVGKKLAHILCGGDIPFGTPRTEWDLLDLEREAFLSLCGEPKSQARMQAMLQTGKPLRN
jgi:3-hydroxyacyl-CoA dehydrogenase